MDNDQKSTTATDRSSTCSSNKRRTYIVTGGSGFLGSHIVEYLLNHDHNVIVLDSKYPSNEILMQIEQSYNKKSKFVLCDISSRYNDIYRIFSTNLSHSYDSEDSIECVFHCAALTDAWSPPYLYKNINVNGTLNIIRACRECNITKLIYTSSSCVVLNGQDCQNGDESMKYINKNQHLNAYSYSKHCAEEKILLSNNTSCSNENLKLLTCALRPHCIFGPRDTHFISQIINKAKDGKITHIIGEGHNITDFTYIDNVVYAHILAAKKLKSKNNYNTDKKDNNKLPIAAGQVYFITNGEPTLFWSFIGCILQQLGCPRPNKYISYNVAYAIALIMEFIYWLFGWIFGWKPIITREMVVTMSCHHWFNHSKATRDLGYKPIVTLNQGIKRTVKWYIDKQQMPSISSTGSISSIKSFHSNTSNNPQNNFNNTNNNNNNNTQQDVVDID